VARWIGTPPAILWRKWRTYSDLGKEEPTMREKLVILAKQAVKLLAIELFVPGGTLVVLAILLTRGSASWTSGRLAALVPTSWRDLKAADHPEYALESY